MKNDTEHCKNEKQKDEQTVSVLTFNFFFLKDSGL